MTCRPLRRPSRRSGPIGSPRPLASVGPVVVAVIVALTSAACGGGGSGSDPGAAGAPVVTARLDGRDLERPQPAPAEADDPTDRSTPTTASAAAATEPVVRSGADVLAVDGPDRAAGLPDGARVGLIANRASTVAGQPIIDVLDADPAVELVALFAPEHGVEAAAPSGSSFRDGVDPATGLVVHSLYGADRAPSAASLADLDALVFDLPDVGARFYTYTATMGLAMQAAARAGIPFVVLDRPNPLGGDRPDGPTRDGSHESFVGLYPIPTLHGLTAGELALAIQGEGWLADLDDLDLRVVELDGWNRTMRWDDTGLAWVAPSPGLPTAESALLYPATVLLEATTVSFGRGTDHPFVQVGAPWLDGEDLAARLEADGLAGVRFEPVRFTPEAGPDPADGSQPAGAGTEVRYAGETIPGVRLAVTDRAAIRPFEVGVHLLHHVLDLAGDRVVIDRPDHLDLLAGQDALRRDLVAGVDPEDIVASWSADLTAWDLLVEPYRLYPMAT